MPGDLTLTLHGEAGRGHEPGAVPGGRDLTLELSVVFTEQRVSDLQVVQDHRPPLSVDDAVAWVAWKTAIKTCK